MTDALGRAVCHNEGTIPDARPTAPGRPGARGADAVERGSLASTETCRAPGGPLEFIEPSRARRALALPFPETSIMSRTARLWKGAGPLTLGGLLLSGAVALAGDQPRPRWPTSS